MISVITTVSCPTQSVKDLAEKLVRSDSSLIVIGDQKGPEAYPLPGCEFLSLDDQRQLPFELARTLPTGHYARKNVGYLCAFQRGSEPIYETDDDNAPLESWQPRSLTVQARTVHDPMWVNVYKFFTSDFIWPRGLPLDHVRNGHTDIKEAGGPLHEVRAPIQQGLADNSPDVDAVWRLLHDKEFTFERNPSVYLEPGTWCPFNSQSTWWWPDAYPLMYIPSFCSFRMCDIWRSFVAQRCLWELGHGLVFHSSEVRQDRNVHDLMRDFEDEIPGYRGNHRFALVLERLTLKPGIDHTLDNLARCYEVLIAAGFFPEKEMELVKAWVHDVESVL